MSTANELLDALGPHVQGRIDDGAGWVPLGPCDLADNVAEHLLGWIESIHDPSVPYKHYKVSDITMAMKIGDTLLCEYRIAPGAFERIAAEIRTPGRQEIEVKCWPPAREPWRTS